MLPVLGHSRATPSTAAIWAPPNRVQQFRSKRETILFSARDNMAPSCSNSTASTQLNLCFRFLLLSVALVQTTTTNKPLEANANEWATVAHVYEPYCCCCCCWQAHAHPSGVVYLFQLLLFLLLAILCNFWGFSWRHLVWLTTNVSQTKPNPTNNGKEMAMKPIERVF